MRKLAVYLLTTGMVVSTGLLASACGGGTTPGVASLGSTTTTTAATGQGTSGSGTKQHLALQFAKCMRSHGVRNFPEGNGPIKIGPSSGIDPNSPTFRTAQKDCRSLLPKPSPAQVRQAEQNALKFSKCMRAHGVPNFPDPQFLTGGLSIRISAGGGGGLNPRSPAFQAAQQACANYLHLSKGGPGKQGSGAVVAP
jgi:hypothetical protein